jgi:3-keto-disaccharide hydrolase
MLKRTFLSGLSALALAATVFGCATSGSGGDWVTLLDGSMPKTMDSWYQSGDQANWRIVDGAVQADKAGKSSYLVSRESYKDFQVRAEFWADTTTNSGIFIRIQDPKSIGSKSGYEVNINDLSPNAGFGTGGIPNFGKADPNIRAGGKWNTYLITARGSHLVIVLNGVQTLDINDGTFSNGPIALQFGGGKSGPIKWRKVEIRPL